MRILLVEDDRVIATAIREQAESEGHSVDWAARLDAADDACSLMLGRVISEDTGLSANEAELLASGLLGMAQIAARRWLREDPRITREAAVDLIAGLGWRGIGGFPLSHPPQA